MLIRKFIFYGFLVDGYIHCREAEKEGINFPVFSLLCNCNGLLSYKVLFFLTNRINIKENN